MRLLKNGTKIGNATVIVDIVDGANREIRPRTKMNPRFLTDHDTGNSGNGADAKSHNRYIHNLGDKLPRDTSHISWHVTVDENFIIQHIPFDECAYHCGDGWATTSGNRTSIGIEKCMHRGADRNKIEANAIALYAYLMKELKIPITSVRPHQHWSGKYCPQLILNRYGSFTPFRNKIEAAFKGGAVTAAKPSTVKRDYLLDGDTGAAVKTLQSELKQAGFLLSVDGIFGKGTETAVKAFQRANGLAVDGVFGTGSQAKLNAILANLNKKPVVKPAAPTKPKEESTVEKTKQPSKWAEVTIKEAVKIGVSDGSRLHDTVTREESIVIAMRAAGLAPRLK
nr:PlyM30 [uncultured phage]